MIYRTTSYKKKARIVLEYDPHQEKMTLSTFTEDAEQPEKRIEKEKPLSGHSAAFREDYSLLRTTGRAVRLGAAALGSRRAVESGRAVLRTACLDFRMQRSPFCKKN